MRLRFVVVGLSTIFAVAGAPSSATAQAGQPSIELAVNAGRPLRVALDERIRLTRVGQPVSGVVIEPVYAYDRIVIAVGTKVRGHVVNIDSGSKVTVARAYVNGNFSPSKHVLLRFDTLVLDADHEVPIDTVVKGGAVSVTRRVAGDSATPRRSGSEQIAANGDVVHPSLAMRARSEIRQRTTEAVSDVKQRVSGAFGAIRSLRRPGQMHRLTDAAVQQLPYHPQYLAKGTVYDAELATPIAFGRVIPVAAAPGGTLPAPDSVLTARLATTLDSSKTPRGTPFEAVITETVFSSEHEVVLPEGTRLTGEVTFAMPARRFHRNGRLRFLFERVQLPNQPSAPLLGALHSIDASRDDRVEVDDEGGTTVKNAKTRFIAPALSLMMLRASMERDGRRFKDPDGDGSMRTAGSGAGSRGLGGFLGIGVVGAAASQITRPIGIALGVYGAARTIYGNVLGKGREVVFTADTPIQVRLAPGPSVP